MKKLIKKPDFTEVIRLIEAARKKAYELDERAVIRKFRITVAYTYPQRPEGSIQI